ASKRARSRPTLEQLLPLRHEMGERAGVRWCSGNRGGKLRTSCRPYFNRSPFTSSPPHSDTPSQTTPAPPHPAPSNSDAYSPPPPPPSIPFANPPNPPSLPPAQTT